MSRWVNGFKNHPFQAVWNDLKGKLEASEVDGSKPSDVEELARLKKVVVFIDNALENIDPELFPQNVLNSFNQQSTECRNHIQNYNSNKNIGHLQNANSNADNLLSYIRPYMIHESSMKKTLLAAVRAYNNEMEKSLEHFNETAFQELSNILEARKKADIYKADAQSDFESIEESKIKILDFEEELFEGSNEQISLQKKLQNLEQDIEEKYQKIIQFYTEVFEDNEEEDTESIKTALRKIKENYELDLIDANKKLEHLKSLMNDLDLFYKKIYGQEIENEDGTTKIKEGLEQYLNERLKQLELVEQTQTDKYSALFDKIESLLPGATSAGLASAYKDMKESFDEPIKHWNWIFIGSVLLMFFATFISFVHFELAQNGSFVFSFADTASIDKTLNNLLYKIPLYGPLVWLAIFASKRRSEMQRLQQEYAHKEALAKSYDSYKTQIEQLDKEDQKLLLKLLDSSIDTIANNASETLDGKHGDGTPFAELLKQFKALKDVVK